MISSANLHNLFGCVTFALCLLFVCGFIAHVVCNCLIVLCVLYFASLHNSSLMAEASAPRCSSGSQSG